MSGGHPRFLAIFYLRSLGLPASMSWAFSAVQRLACPKEGQPRSCSSRVSGTHRYPRQELADSFHYPIRDSFGVLHIRKSKKVHSGIYSIHHDSNQFIFQCSISFFSLFLHWPSVQYMSVWLPLLSAFRGNWSSGQNRFLVCITTTTKTNKNITLGKPETGVHIFVFKWIGTRLPYLSCEPSHQVLGHRPSCYWDRKAFDCMNSLLMGKASSRDWRWGPYKADSQGIWAHLVENNMTHAFETPTGKPGQTWPDRLCLPHCVLH